MPAYRCLRRRSRNLAELNLHLAGHIVNLSLNTGENCFQGRPSKTILFAADGHLHHKVLKLRLTAELGAVVPLMVNHFFERPARMVNRGTSLREPYGQQMINLQRLRDAEEGLEHDTEIRRRYIADVHGSPNTSAARSICKTSTSTWTGAWRKSTPAFTRRRW